MDTAGGTTPHAELQPRCGFNDSVTDAFQNVRRATPSHLNMDTHAMSRRYLTLLPACRTAYRCGRGPRASLGPHTPHQAPRVPEGPPSTPQATSQALARQPPSLFPPRVPPQISNWTSACCSSCRMLRPSQAATCPHAHQVRQLQEAPQWSMQHGQQQRRLQPVAASAAGRMSWGRRGVVWVCEPHHMTLLGPYRWEGLMDRPWAAFLRGSRSIQAG